MERMTIEELRAECAQRFKRIKQDIADIRSAPGADYAGDHPELCNARTKAGHPCRSRALENGRCKWHGGMSTGPKTRRGCARGAANLPRKMP